MLPAAWRKMCVELGDRDRRARPRARRTACRRRPGASWSASPTSTTCVRGPTARSSVTSSSRLAIDVSSTIEQVASAASLVASAPRRGSSRARRGPSRPRARWTRPSAARRGRSARRAATDACCASAAAQISRIVAVLPVPGPAGDDREPRANAARTPAHCSGAGTRSPSGGRSGRASGAGSPRRAARATRAASSASSAAGRRPVGPDRRRPRPRARARRRRHLVEQRRRSGGAPSSAPAPAASSATGRQVEPSRSASASTWSTPARARAGSSARPRPRARSRSAIAKPTPKTLVSVVRALAHDAVRAVAVLLVDARHEPGEPVRREQQVQRARRAQRVPRARPPRPAPRVQARRRGSAARGSRSIASSTCLAVARRAASARAGADVADALEVGEQRGVARGRQRLGGAHADLEPEAPVLLPGPLDPHPLARLEMGERADEDDLVPVAIGVEHREARLLARPAHARDHHLAAERRAGDPLDHLTRGGPLRRISWIVTMLHLHRAERADALVDALGALLADPLPDPFAPDVVAVPTRGVERWLAQRLSTRLGTRAGRADGICANVAFPTPRALVEDAVAVAAGVDPDADPWRPARMVWPLLEVVEAGLGEPWLRTLAAHLDGTTRRFAAVRHLAGLFDRYALHRPEVVAAWSRGEGEHWQAELWRRLAERIGTPDPAARRGRLRPDRGGAGAPPPRRRGSRSSASRGCPAGRLEVLRALAAARDVHLFLLHPSPGLWAGSRASRAPGPAPGGRRLRPAGREPPARVVGPGRARAAARARGRGRAGGAPPRHRAAAGSLLAALQADVRADRAPPGPPLPGVADDRPLLGDADRSVTIHACHGRARQVEVLRDAILHLLAADPTLEPRDVIVMCPDIEAFAPLVHATFGAGEREPRLAGPARRPLAAPDEPAAGRRRARPGAGRGADDRLAGARSGRPPARAAALPARRRRPRADGGLGPRRRRALGARRGRAGGVRPRGRDRRDLARRAGSRPAGRGDARGGGLARRAPARRGRVGPDRAGRPARGAGGAPRSGARRAARAAAGRGLG